MDEVLEEAPVAQHQERQPGVEAAMRPAPRSLAQDYVGNRKLVDKVALITGGDSGIGRSTAVCFAKEGADVAIVYLDEHEDAQRTRDAVLAAGRHCQLIHGDIGDPDFVVEVVRKTVEVFGHIDVLVNNAAEQHPQERIEDVTHEQLERTFRTNFFAMFDLCREALPYLREGGSIINTSSVTAYRGSSHLLDYASSKGAIVSFTRSLSQQLAERNIRVNAVAPGPVWTPLIPSTFAAEKVANFGKDVPLGRVGQPDEISPSFVFLASRDSSYIRARCCIRTAAKRWKAERSRHAATTMERQARAPVRPHQGKPEEPRQEREDRRGDSGAHGEQGARPARRSQAREPDLGPGHAGVAARRPALAWRREGAHLPAALCRGAKPRHPRALQNDPRRTGKGGGCQKVMSDRLNWVEK